MAPRDNKKKRASVAPASALPLPIQNGPALPSPEKPKEPPAKRSKVDPIFADIIATLQGAEELNEQCREMLIAFAAPSLSTPKSDRHDVQQLGVRMIGETLKEHYTKLLEAVATAQKVLSVFEGSKNELLQCFEDAKILLEKRQDAKMTAQAAHTEAKASVEAAECALSEVQDQKRKGDDTIAALEKSKTDINAVYLEHFKAPMEADEGPHHSFLKPFIENLGLEESLINALPSSCLKPKEQRGGFDDLVLASLEKALLGKIATLEQSLADEAPGDSERKAAVACAQEALEGKMLAEKTAADNLETATSAQREAEEKVNAAALEWENFEPRVKEAAEKLNLHETKQCEFEEGPLKTFHYLQDKEASTLGEEAATLGA